MVEKRHKIQVRSNKKEPQIKPTFITPSIIHFWINKFISEVIFTFSFYKRHILLTIIGNINTNSHLGLIIRTTYGGMHVTNFSSISYHSNVRLISKIELEQNLYSIILDIHASANERPSHIFSFKLRSTNKYWG